MAAQERIIGGGFLFIGVAIVLVLLYFFTWGGTGSKEAYDQIVGEIFPAYETAEKKHDYLAMKAEAKRLADKLEEGGREAVLKHITAEATGARGPIARLDRFVRKGTFTKNAEGLFAYEDGWYQEASHRALRQLTEAIDQRLKALHRVRDTAISAREALAGARIGSGHPLELPPAKGKANDISVIDPNPVYRNDEELYRVFGLDAAALDAALATPAPAMSGGKDWQARSAWNDKIAGSDLGDAVGSLPEQAAELQSIATQIETAAKLLANDAAAAKPLGTLVARGAALLGSQLSPEHRAAFQQNIKSFEKDVSIVNVLRAEANMLAAYKASMRQLGASFKKRFP